MIDTLIPPASAVSSAGEFIRLTMQETGCPRAVAHAALRLIVRRHRPQRGRLHQYLARFTSADRAHWVEQALATERGALASILIGELAAQRSVDRAVTGVEADRAMLALARGSSHPGDGRPRGIALLDAALREMAQGSPRAAAAIAAVCPQPTPGPATFAAAAQVG